MNKFDLLSKMTEVPKMTFADLYSLIGKKLHYNTAIRIDEYAKKNYPGRFYTIYLCDDGYLLCNDNYLYYHIKKD